MTLAITLLAGCASIPKELAPKQLITPPTGPFIFVSPKVPSSISDEKVWMDVSVAFEMSSTRGNKTFLQPVDFKMVNSSHPESRKLFESVEKWVGKSIFRQYDTPKVSGIGDYKGKRYLIRLAQNANNSALLVYVHPKIKYSLKSKAP